MKNNAAIREIRLKSACLRAEGIQTADVNLIFGRNGTGKSTLCRAILEDEGPVWAEGLSRESFDILRFDADYADEHLRRCRCLPGVITVHPQDGEAQRELEDRLARRARIEEQGRVLRARLEEMDRAARQEETAFQDAVWAQSARWRAAFPQLMRGSRTKAGFRKTLMETGQAVFSDFDELKDTYQVAFGGESGLYRLLRSVEPFDGIEGQALLSQPLMSSGSSQFARFIERIQASDWVRSGHTWFEGKARGRCPYCQQALPVGFEAELAACFDDSYDKAMEDLRSFLVLYEKRAQGSLWVLSENPEPPEDVTPEGFVEWMSMLPQMVSLNLERIRYKLDNPSETVTLTDTRAAVERINAMILGINVELSRRNVVLAQKQQSRKKLEKRVWEAMAYEMKGITEVFRQKQETAEQVRRETETEIAECREKWKAEQAHVAALQRAGVNTVEAMEHVNARLREAGFADLGLRPRRDPADSYEVVRRDGTLAETLSDGERNLIAFLYFCETVWGDGERERIVVLDDPTVYMDRQASYLSSRLIGNMADECGKRGKIRQLFLMTHDEGVFHQVARRHIQYGENEFLYRLVKKDGEAAAERIE